MGDVFEAFFGGADPVGRRGPSGPAQGADAEVLIELTLEEAAFGTTHSFDARLPVACGACEGSGCEPGTHPSGCETCGGAGEVRQIRRSLLGQIITAAPCRACAGTGRRILSPCATCRGDGRVEDTRSIDVEVPPGVDEGQRLRLTGRGAAAPRGGHPGDLYVTIRVEPHPSFRRLGDDLLHVCRISIAQATLGAHLEIPTLDGSTEVTVAPGTQPGHQLRVKGEGVPVLRGRGRGDLVVQLDVEIPTRLSDEERTLLREFASLRGEEVTVPERGLFSRLRSSP
jgi:molecular chaperone DnaJ